MVPQLQLLSVWTKLSDSQLCERPSRNGSEEAAGLKSDDGGGEWERIGENGIERQGAGDKEKTVNIKCPFSSRPWDSASRGD